jgi:hypothetical protein
MGVHLCFSCTSPQPAKDRPRARAPWRGDDATSCHLRDAAPHLQLAERHSVGAGHGCRKCRTPVRRKQCEDLALLRSEAYLAEAQRLSHSGVASYNETEILHGSEETYRIWGLTRRRVFRAAKLCSNGFTPTIGPVERRSPTRCEREKRLLDRV